MRTIFYPLFYLDIQSLSLSKQVDQPQNHDNRIMKKLLVLENHPITLNGITSLIKKDFDTTEVYEAKDSDSAFTILEHNSVDLIILSANSHSENLIDIEKIRNSIPVVLYYRDFKSALEAKKKNSNILGLLSQLCTPQELIKCITNMEQNQSYFCDTTLRYTLEYLLKSEEEAPKRTIKISHSGESLAALSKREKQINDLILQGKGTSEIATALNLKMSTISTVKHKILKKMKVTNVVELLRKHNKDEQ